MTQNLSQTTRPSTVIPFFYDDATDPDLDAANHVIAGKVWRDSSTSPAVWKVRDPTNTSWTDLWSEGYTQSDNVDALAGLTGAADKGVQFTGAGTMGTYDLTAAGKALLDDAAASNQRDTLELGTSATLDIDTDGALTADSDDLIPTQKAVKAYADAIAAAAGAPTNAQYLTLATNGTLTVERVFTPAARLTATDGGAGSTYTVDLTNNVRDVAIPFVIDGGGSAITTGVKGYIEVPFSGTIQSVRMLADQSGSIVVDVWKDSYANYPPVNADSITASAPPTISTATKSEDTTLTGWTTSITAGDILGFNVDSATTVERVTLSLVIRKS